MKYSLSIVILSYNVKQLLDNCLASILADRQSAYWQIIVVDNASSDGSAEMVKRKYKQVEVIEAKSNLGFSAGNNLASKKVKSDNVLFLNPDTVIVGQVISETLKLLESDTVGAVTCRVELPDGRLDYSCHRGLPTPWNAVAYFSGLAGMFSKSKLFSGYTATYLDLNKTHEIDCATGAFLLVKRRVLDEIGWWDEDYFWNGEDVELCYQIRKRGYKIVYYPNEKIIHFKGSSSGIWSTGAVKVDEKTKQMAKKAGIEAMRVFFKKHYGNSVWVGLGIRLLELKRLLLNRS